MTMTDVSNLSDLADCSVEIEVTGMYRHTLMTAGTSIVKVPYSSLSRTMQYIQRSGGKIVKVTRLSGNLPVASVPIATTSVTASTPAPETEVVVPATVKPKATKAKAKATPPEPVVEETVAPPAPTEEITPVVEVEPVAELEPVGAETTAEVETVAETPSVEPVAIGGFQPKTKAGKSTTKRGGKKPKK